MKNIKFPTPQAFKLKDNIVLCPHGQILKLYSQATGKNQQKITDMVKHWVEQQAKNHGWYKSLCIPETQSSCAAGFLLLRVSIAELSHSL